MQNWQHRTEYAEEISLYRPELFSVIMRIPTSQNSYLNPGSHLDFEFGKSETSLGSFKKSREQLGWLDAIPRLIRKLTMSQVEVNGNSQIQWVSIFT